MTTITKERIELFIKNPLENGLTRGEQMELARITMASLEAEPIGAFHIADQQVGGTSDYIKDGEWPIDNGVIDVYAVPPVQETGVYKDMLNIIGLLEKNEWAEHCTSTVLGSLLESEITRLVSKEQPTPVVPEKLPCSVELKPGLIIGKGCKTETLLTALRRRADCCAKIDAFKPEERAEHDASIEAFKVMLPTSADSQDRLRAPVVPDEITSTSAPEAFEIAEEAERIGLRGSYASYAVGWNACRAAMLQGAEPVSQTYELPELIEGMEVSIDVSTCDADAGNRYFGTVTEVSELDTAKNGYILLVQDAEPNFDVNGNSPVIPGGWISCSERMPDNDESKPIAIFTGKCLGQGMFVATYDDDGFFDYWEGMEIIGVSHWMPLPAAPEPDQS